MTQQEEIRLNEIVFCNLFKDLLQQHKNPIKVYDLITAVAGVVDANVIVLNSVITAIFANDRNYMPQANEYAVLLYKSGVSVRNICKEAHLSQTTYYKINFDEQYITPKFTPIQYAEIIKVMKFFKAMGTDLERALV